VNATILPRPLADALRRAPKVLHYVTADEADHTAMRRAVEAAGGQWLAARGRGRALHLLADVVPPTLRGDGIAHADAVQLAAAFVRGGCIASAGWAALLGRKGEV
jgi:hypothetical protein